jgi:hypothetical protein
MAKDDSAEVLASNSVATAVALGSAVAATYGRTDLATGIAVVGAAAPGIAQGLVRVIQAKIQERFHSFERGIHRVTGRTVDEVAAAAVNCAPLVDAYKHMMEALDPCVSEACGRLAGAYLADNRAPDQLFRAVGRLLEAVGPEEFSVLCSVVAGVVRTPHKLTADTVVMNYRTKATQGATVGPFAVLQGNTWHHLRGRDGRPLPYVPSLQRIFFLLKSEGLAQVPDMPPKWGEGANTEALAQVWVEPFTVLDRVLNPPDTAK